MMPGQSFGKQEKNTGNFTDPLHGRFYCLRIIYSFSELEIGMHFFI